jgi:hypothetical protein
MPTEEQLIGLSKREAKQKVTEINKQKDQVMKRLHEISSNSRTIFPDAEYRELEKKLINLEQEASYVYEQYNIGLLESSNSLLDSLNTLTESLKQESKTLTTLTKWLIGLTTTLGVLAAINILLTVIMHV